MENISNLQIMQLSKSITSKESAEGILANFLPVVENATFDSQKIRTRSQDNISKALLPSGFEEMVPLSATADGNCLFHSASILLSGDESLAPTLRMLTASELFAYSEFYSTHPQLTRATQAADYSIGAVLNIFLSNRKAEKVFNGDMNSISRAIEMLAQETATPSVYASPFVILALASVLGKPVFSIYPDVPTSISIKRAIHGVFHPRQAILAGDLHQQDEKNDFLYIMWTRSAYSPLFDWKPNHFVPLVPLNKPGKTPVKSYSDAVKCKVNSGRGRASQSSFFQYKSDRRRVPPTSSISVESDEDSTPPSTKQNHKKPIPTKKTTSFKKSPTTSNVPLKDQRSSEIPCGTTSLPKCKEPPSTSASSPSTKQNHKKPNSSNKTTSLKNSSTTSNAPFKDRCSSEIPRGTKSVHQREWEAASTEESSAKMRKLNTSFDAMKPGAYTKPRFQRQKRGSTTSVTTEVYKKRQEKAVGSTSITNYLKVTTREPLQEDHEPENSKSCSEDYEIESLLPLQGPGLAWYQERGRNAAANCARTEERQKNSVILEKKRNDWFDTWFSDRATRTEH